MIKNNSRRKKQNNGKGRRGDLEGVIGWVF
jgi:hypothetical protein